MQSPAGLALPVLREPCLEWLSPSDAFEDGEPNLFSLMRWDYCLVKTLYGRDDDLNKILSWAENGSKITSARLITGEGGAGKTRLAATAAQILRERGWTAGFLPRENARIEFTVGSNGLFLILDYPEEQPERTKALLSELADRKTAPYPLRVLFLSRRSFADWERETLILQGRFGRQEIAIPEPLSVEDGARLIEEAARNFVTYTKSIMPNLKEARDWLVSSSTHRLPLYAMAAAIHAVLSPSEAFGLAGGELLKNLALREIRRVQSISELLGLGREGLEHLLALGVLADTLSERPVIELAQAGACDNSKPDIVKRLARSPWWKNGRLIRLEPDPLAAAFFNLALFDRKFPKGQDALSEWLFIAIRENAATFGNRLERILYDLHALGHTDEGFHPLNERLVRMLIDKPERAVVFSDVARSHMHFWGGDFAAQVAIILAKMAEKQEDKALFLNNASIDLLMLGRREEALAAAQEAVSIRRALARARPEAFTPDLATSFNTLGNSLSELGCLEEALTAAQEAAQLYRDLARARPEAFTSGLAMSLNNLANRLSELDRLEEALTMAQEAAQLYRDLARARPEAFTSGLAMSLHNLADSLSALDRQEEALTAAQEAAQLYRDLARARPEAFTSDLAGSLNGLSIRLYALDRQEEALTAAQEAAQLYRDLARASPEAFTSDLAMSLHNLADSLSNLGRLEEALAASQEAVSIRRDLARARPEAFTPVLARSLHNHANRLSELGRREEALAASQEAVSIHRDLARARPEAFSPDLAGSLNNLANRLSELDRLEEGLTMAQEAAQLYRDLMRARPEAFTPDLALSLHTLSNTLFALCHNEEALTAAQESAWLYRSVVRTGREAFTPNLARSLDTLATILSVLGRNEEALTSEQESVNLYRSVVQVYPEVFRPYLAGSLNKFADILSNLGRHEEALTIYAELKTLS